MTDQAFDRREGWIWMDGALTPWKEAGVHILTHGLHYAGAAFEGERAYGGRIFALEEHGRRLLRSSSILGMECPWTAGELDRAAEEVVRANDIGDGYVRRLVWRGSEAMGVSPGKTRTHAAVAAWPWPSYFSPERLREGLRLDWASWRRPAPETAPWRAKVSGLYMICSMSKHAAEENGYDDALMLDWRGRVSEATGANIFFVKKDVLHTPTPDCFLDGITRRTVIGLAKGFGLEVVERAIMPTELADFDECFLTGTAAEVAQVGSIGDLRFRIGPVGERLRDAYLDTVRAGEEAILLKATA